MKNILRKGLVALTAAMLFAMMFASGAQAATSDQNHDAGYINTMRNKVGLPSLSINEEVNASAQAWANHLASVDSGTGAVNPTPATPAGFVSAGRLFATYPSNYPDGAMAVWKTKADDKATIYDTTYNTVGTGQAVGKSGTVYIVADLEQINQPEVLTPLPAPAPAPVVAVPAPAVVQQPAPVQAPPVEQAPAESAPAAPVEPAPAPEAPKPIATPAETVKPTATPTPSASASASESASPSEPATSMDATRTSDNKAIALNKGTVQAASLGGGGLVTALGGVLMYRNRKVKPLAE